MADNEIEVEINGQRLAAKREQTVIQVADAAGIYIPRFCYHKHLSIPANCRMCLVEVEKSPKALPACATPVMPGMKVFTQSVKTQAAQRAVMEYLLINHPLDCPICDQGGECELQDLAMGYGSCHSRYKESKRSVADENLGPLIATDMTRCITCTRCVRFGDEVAGMRELGALYRGENTEISTYIQQAIHSEVSGNIIDICPVGALTSKPFRFRARAWELDQAPSVSPHDCIGSNLAVHTRYGKVMRVVSRENTQINKTWISDRDRFSYTGLYHADRLEKPLIKENGKWEVVSWQRAFEVAASTLNSVLLEHGADQLGALSNPSATLEEFYLLQKMIRGLGSSHIDHRLREIDVEDQSLMGTYPGLNMTINELGSCDVILLIGTNLPKEQPLIGLEIRKAANKQIPILVINPMQYRFNFKTSALHIITPKQWVNCLSTLNDHFGSKKIEVNDALSAFVEHLSDKKNPCILLGSFALHHEEASTIRHLAKAIADKIGAKVGLMTDGSNSAGGWLAGAIPNRRPGAEPVHAIGLSAYEMLEKPRKAYVLLNVEPELDCANAYLARQALKQAKGVIALSMYRNKVLEECAHVILPIAPFTETDGTFVNAWGVWQSFKSVATAFGESRPAWKVLRVLSNFLHLDGFNFESSEEVRHEIKHIIDKMSVQCSKEKENENNKESKPLAKEEESNQVEKRSTLARIGEIPIYAIDSLVRRATPLQATQVIMEGDVNTVRIHPETARKLQLSDGDRVKISQSPDSVCELPISFDERVAKDAAWIAGGIETTSELGNLFGDVMIEKVK